MSETTNSLSEYEFGVAPESTKQYGDNSPWATFGGGETGRAMAITHAWRNPGNRVVRRHEHSTAWTEDAVTPTSKPTQRGATDA